MTSQGPVREEFLEPLRRTLGWLSSLRDGQGRIWCPEHGLEHTGKSACVAVLAAALARHDPKADRAHLRSLACAQGRRLVANLVREGTSPCHTFRPGRHDPFNCSNSVIDGGACSDALSEIVHEFGPEMEAAERERCAAASLLHARTYLRYAVLDKGIPAQRAWGLTGLAAAHSLEADQDLERAALEAVGVLEGIQNGDGSYPYHPLEWGAQHPGSADVSSFYQSRITAFLLFSLERLGRDPTSEVFAGPLQRGLDFLLALQGSDGLKCGLVEAKPWYWGATYEVASNPFDVYALARGWRHFPRARLATGALRAFRAWAAHLDRDGRPQSHLPGPGRGRSYQCPLFWAAHAMWIARALPDLEAAASATLPRSEAAPGGIDLSVAWFPDAALGRIDDGCVTAWVRGARPPYNLHHGSPHGAGLLRVLRRADGRELLERCRLGGSQEAEWSGHAGLPSLARAWQGGGGELRFSLWQARVHARAGRWGAALRAPLVVAQRGLAAFGSSRVSSAFSRTARVRLDGDGIELESGLAWRGGAELGGARLTRRFQVDGEGLQVSEKLIGGEATYGVPAAAQDVLRTPDGISYRLA